MDGCESVLHLDENDEKRTIETWVQGGKIFLGVYSDVDAYDYAIESMDGEMAEDLRRMLARCIARAKGT